VAGGQAGDVISPVALVVAHCCQLPMSAQTSMPLKGAPLPSAVTVPVMRPATNNAALMLR